MKNAEDPTEVEAKAQESTSETPSQFLSWPPPGLEAAQGKLWPPIALIALGDITLVFPLLWSMASDQQAWSFGPFGSSWWVPLLTAAIGILILSNGLVSLFRLLTLFAKNSRQGHGFLIQLQVAADFPKDGGFLLQGARLYSGMPGTQRRLLLLTRIVGASAYLLAALWAPLGFALVIMMGARGWIGPSGAWFFTIAPVALLLLVGVLSRILSRKLSWSARRDRELRAAVDREVRDLVSEWNYQSQPVIKELGFETTAADHSRSFRIGSVFVVLLALLVVVPAGTVTVTSAVGSIFAAIALPNLDQAQARIAVAEVLRRYSREADGSVSPQQAGDALHTLMSTATQTQERVLVREPVRVYRDDWFPEGLDSVVDGALGDWALGLFAKMSSGLTSNERRYLAAVASHPAHVEFETVAMADSVDVIGSRYLLPFPDSVTPFLLPIPSFRGIHRGASAHVALAALQLSRGNRTEAEATIKEVISVGFALIDEGSTIIDGMIGARLVDTGAEALEQLYRATGRTGEADNLSWVRTGMEEALEKAAVTRAVYDAESALQLMPDAVLNEMVGRGLRWEYFLTFVTLAPCVNLNKVIFGPGQDFEQWLEDAEDALVRRASEQQMFRFLRQGWFRGAGAYEAPGWMIAALRFTFGGTLGGTCAAQLGGLDMVSVVQ